MKRLLLVISLSFALGVSCSNGDDDLKKGLEDLEKRVAKLEELSKEITTNVSSLQNIVTASRSGDDIKTISPITKGGVVSGYTLAFSNSGTSTVYFEEGNTNSDAPVLSIKKHTDGVYYWTLNGTWLKNANNQMLKAQGESTISPQLKVDNNKWMLSVDGGKTWKDTGNIVGEAEQSSNCCFSKIEQDENEVRFVLTDGTTIKVPKYKPFAISFNPSDITVRPYNPESSYTISYTIRGADDNTIIQVSGDSNYNATVTTTDNSSGEISITAIADKNGTIIPINGKIIVFVSNTTSTLMRFVNLTVGAEEIDEDEYYLASALSVPATTESTCSMTVDYKITVKAESVELPSWVQLSGSIKANPMQFVVTEENNSIEHRLGIGTFKDAQGKTVATFPVFQRSLYSKVIVPASGKRYNDALYIPAIKTAEIPDDAKSWISFDESSRDLIVSVNNTSNERSAIVVYKDIQGNLVKDHLGNTIHGVAYVQSKP